MPEATQVQYKHLELVTLMLKDQGIHEGIWMLSVSFGFSVANVGVSEAEMNPAAIVPLGSIGIQRMPEMGPLCSQAVQAARHTKRNLPAEIAQVQRLGY